MSVYLVLGAGGHGKVVADILVCQGKSVLGFLDDDSSRWRTTCLDLPILGSINEYATYQPTYLILGIGSNVIRQETVEHLGDGVHDLWCNAIHPKATIASSVRIGRDVVIAAGAVVNPDASIGDHVIINTGATVDHDCVIGDYVHISPGVHLAGTVCIGEGTLIGIGASIAPGHSVGDWAVVGAGSVVVRDIPAYAVAMGVPARWKVKQIDPR